MHTDEESMETSHTALNMIMLPQTMTAQIDIYSLDTVQTLEGGPRTQANDTSEASRRKLRVIVRKVQRGPHIALDNEQLSSHS
ncbi:hypothetical protein Tco_0882003 [Tanacetum coccineum]